MLTIAALTVRHEFCVQIEEAGGLKFIFDGMVKHLHTQLLAKIIFIFIFFFAILQKEHSDSIRVSKEALKLLRALAGNDGTKKNILKDDAAKLIDDIINVHKVSSFCSASIWLHCHHPLSFIDNFVVGK